MRVAIITEGFLPDINGTTSSVLRMLEHLRREEHEALVIAPGARGWQEKAELYYDYRIERVPTVIVPLTDSLPIGVSNRRVAPALTQFKPDVAHLASPFVLDGAGALTAKALGIPTVAIYQTGVAGFVKNCKLAGLSTAAWLWTRMVHNSCTRTLAPSSPAIEGLQNHKVRDVYRWGRSVDVVRFTPTKRSKELRKQWNPEDKPIVGYTGRLTAEKSVERLTALSGRDDIQVVIVGNGPELPKLKKLMPNAVFTGQLTGDKLVVAFTNLDVFIHTGDSETLCQAVQEAHASGTPAIAPNVGSPRDPITNDVNGHLLEPKTFTRDPSEAVGKLLLVDDGLARKWLYNRYRGTVTERIWEALYADLVRHYEEVSGVSATETSSKVTADTIDASRAGAATCQKSVT